MYALYADPDADFDKLAAEQGRLEEIIQAHDGHNLNVQLERAADALRLPDWDAKIANLSGGERRRVALCRLLLEKPDMLLLDEPTNHLDAESVAWLERFLHDFEGTVVAITHDRYFLDNVAGWILELDRGEGIPWEGNYSSWLEQKDQRLAQEASQEAARRKSIEKELEWVDVSNKDWQKFMGKLSKKLLKKGVDGFFIDNCDVYDYAKTKKNFKGLAKILKNIKRLGKGVMINGGDVL